MNETLSGNALWQAVRAAQGNAALQKQALRQVCVDVSQRTGATRASVWVFSAGQTSLRCVGLYDAWHGDFLPETVMHRADYGPYFDAILTDHRVVAPRARSHPATRGFNQIYFEPWDIHSLLDQVVVKDGEARAVLCCEQCGEPRTWQQSDMDVLDEACRLVGALLPLSEDPQA